MIYLHIWKLNYLMIQDLKLIDFQRYLDLDRVSQIKSQVTVDKCILGAITFCTYDQRTYFNLDGQHRLEALKQLYTELPLVYGGIEVMIQIIDIATIEDAKKYYHIINKNSPVKLPDNYFDLDRPKHLVNQLIQTFPKCFTKDDNKVLQRPLIRPNDLLNSLSTKFDLVSNLSNEQLIDLIMNFNTRIKNLPIVQLRKNKRDKTDIIERAKDRASKKGGLYLGMYPSFYDWDTILENTEQPEPAKESKIGISQRSKVWESLAGDKFRMKCPCCQIEEITALKFTIAHNIPVCKGGTDEIGNLRLSCAQCNLECGVKIFDDFLKNKTIYV